MGLSAIGQSNLYQPKDFADIDSFITTQMESIKIPGLSACIIIGDSVVWNGNYGYMNLADSIPVTDTTLFNVFSISKVVTASSVMQLWDNQLLDIDENINNILPFDIHNSWYPDIITPRMLMWHGGTIRDNDVSDYTTIGDPDSSNYSFLENYLCPGGAYHSQYNYYHEIPGTNAHYSNYGVALNGLLVETLAGVDFKQYTRDSVFNLLDMEKSAWFLNDLNIDNLAFGYEYTLGNYQQQPHLGHPAYTGMSLRSTALELSNLVIMLLNHGEFNGQDILSESAIDSMAKVQNPDESTTFGLGLYDVSYSFGNRLAWGHNGGGTSGYAASMFYCEAENSAVVITTNSSNWFDYIVKYLFVKQGLL